MRCVVVGLGAVASSNQPACANRRFSTFLLDCISVEALALHCTDQGGSFGRMCRRNGRGVCVCARAGAVTSSEGLATAYVCRLLRIAAAKTILRDAAPPLARLPPRYLEAVLRLRSLPRVQRAPKPVGSRQVRFAVRVVQRRNHPRLVRAPSAGPSYSFRRGIASGTSRTRSSTRRCASASLTCCSGWYARKSRLRRDSASSASGVLARLPRSIFHVCTTAHIALARRCMRPCADGRHRRTLRSSRETMARRSSGVAHGLQPCN